MPEPCAPRNPQAGRRALLACVALLIAAAIALAGAAALDWVTVGFQVPLRGNARVQVPGSGVQPALGPLALLALAAVAAVLATGGWVRRLLGVVLLGTAIPPALGAAGLADPHRLVRAAMRAGELPARSVPDGTVSVLLAGPVLAGTGALLLAGASGVLILRGHRMPRMGRRYQAPAARSGEPQDRELWDRIDAGEDPTVPGHPR